MSEIDEQQPDTDAAEPQEPQSDPFEGWPAAESSSVIEDEPAEGVSVEHVRGEVQVPDGFTVLTQQDVPSPDHGDRRRLLARRQLAAGK